MIFKEVFKTLNEINEWYDPRCWNIISIEERFRGVIKHGPDDRFKGYNVYYTDKQNVMRRG